MKAIRTQYNGINFRSRLEARWAVFLDALSVPWKYETEGFELDSGRYLPDFWLPEQSVWLEIKRPFDIRYEREREELDRAGVLAGELSIASYRQVIIAACDVGDWGLPGSPGGTIYKIFPRQHRSLSGLGFWDFDENYHPCRCPSCGRFGFEFEGKSVRICHGGCRWNDASPTSVTAAVNIARGFHFWNPKEAA